ncbi:MAG: methyltransferase family protein [Alphaproteobacteria bacterium]
MSSENHKPKIVDVDVIDENENRDARKKDAPKIIALPPNILLVMIVAGLVLNWLFPVSFGHMWGGAGLMILGLSIGLIFWCKILFDRAETNIRPDLPTHAIVTEGPFKYSRNPIYLAFLLGFSGLAMLADAPIMLLLLPILWFVLERYVIRPEEEYLAEKFGEEYTDYMGRTNRWVGVKQDFFS